MSAAIHTIFAVSDNRAGDDHDATATGRLVEMPTGETIITIRVTAENGTTHQDYTVTVHRASS